MTTYKCKITFITTLDYNDGGTTNARAGGKGNLATTKAIETRLKFVHISCHDYLPSTILLNLESFLWNTVFDVFYEQNVMENNLLGVFKY